MMIVPTLVIFFSCVCNACIMYIKGMLRIIIQTLNALCVRWCKVWWSNVPWLQDEEVHNCHDSSYTGGWDLLQHPPIFLLYSHFYSIKSVYSYKYKFFWVYFNYSKSNIHKLTKMHIIYETVHSRSPWFD